MRKNRKTPEINAGSMADIAFLLLIFWLVATTLTPEYGIMNKLVNEEEEPKIAIVTESRDLLRVHVTEDGTYEVEINGTQTLDYDELNAYAVRLRDRSGFRGRFIITSEYNAPYEAYTKVLEIVKNNNLKLIENEIPEENVEERESDS